MSRYQVQAEESDCGLTNIGEVYSNKKRAISVARYMAKAEVRNGGNARQFLVFDLTDDRFIFEARCCRSA